MRQTTIHTQPPARGAVIEYVLLPTPFGECLVASAGHGPLFAWFTNGQRGPVLLRLGAEFPDCTVRPARKPIVPEDFWRLDRPPPGLHLAGTGFQLETWQALLGVPRGETISYTGLAERLGRKRGARAVAGAVARNRIALLVPCHRVVRADGAHGGYRWGERRKRAMLAYEKGLSRSVGAQQRHPVRTASHSGGTATRPPE